MPSKKLLAVLAVSFVLNPWQSGYADSSLLTLTSGPVSQLIIPAANAHVKLGIDNEKRFLVFGTTITPFSCTSNSAKFYRYKTDGTLDKSFANNGLFEFSNGAISSFFNVFVTKSGDYIVSGSNQETICPVVSSPKYFVIKLNKYGMRDMNFGTAGILNDVYFTQTNSDLYYAVIGNQISVFNSNGIMNTSFGDNGVVTLSKSQLQYPILFFQGDDIYATGMIIKSPYLKLPVGVTSIRNGVETDTFKGINDYEYTFGFKDTPISTPLIINGKLYIVASILDSVGPPNVRNTLIFSLNLNGSINQKFGTNGYFRNLLPNSGQLYGEMAFSEYKNNQMIFASYNGTSLVFQLIKANQKSTETPKLIGQVDSSEFRQVSQIRDNEFLTFSNSRNLDASNSVISYQQLLLT